MKVVVVLLDKHKGGKRAKVRGEGKLEKGEKVAGRGYESAVQSRRSWIDPADSLDKRHSKAMLKHKEHITRRTLTVRTLFLWCGGIKAYVSCSVDFRILMDLME